MAKQEVGIIFEDTTDSQVETKHVAGNRGYMRRDWDEHPFCSTFYTKAFPESALIDESEWDDRLRQFELEQNSLEHLMVLNSWEVLDQENTNYCWTNAVTGCAEVTRIKQGDPYIKLSSASVAAPIKNYRNVGGWGSEALEYAVEHGFATARLWGNAVINPGNAVITAANVERKHFKAIEFYELPPGQDMFKCFISALFHRWPCAPGYNWWRHQVMAVKPWKSPAKKWGSRGPNSWGPNQGDKGWYMLEGSKSIPDDCICLHSMTPSEGVQ